MPAPALVLASGSPRRRDLLARLTPDFTIVVSGAEENPTAPPARAFPAIPLPPPFAIPASLNPILWGWRKAVTVAQAGRPDGRDLLVLGADTIVVLDQDVLGKPGDRARAGAMLRRLAGRAHLVVTGWALVAARPQPAGPSLIQTAHYGYVSSRVTMGDYDDAAIEWYIGTGEPLDKAGAYALQGLGGRLVASVHGCHTNVVGLPLCAVRAALHACGWPLQAAGAWHAGCAGPYCHQQEAAADD